MSTMTVINNTKMPIHAATEWDGIVQEFANNILPGETKELPSANFGWQDFVTVIGVNDNKFSHKDDWKNALAFGTMIGGALATVAGVALTIVVPPAGAAVVAAGGSAVLASVATASSVAVAAAGLVALAGAATAEIAGRVDLKPATVTGLWGHDGYIFTISGGDIEGVYDTKTKVLNVAGVTPLIVHWRNKVSGTSGIIGNTR